MLCAAPLGARHNLCKIFQNSLDKMGPEEYDI